MVSFIRNTFIVLIVSGVLSISSFAAGTIPRDGLRLELMLATGAVDTSGNGRIVTATGIGPTYQVDPVYGVPFAQFGGSGGLKVNTSWSANMDFSMSMWMKMDSGFFQNIPDDQAIRLSSPINIGGYTRNITAFRYHATVLFAKLGESDSNGLHLVYAKNGNCSLRTNKEYNPAGALYRGYDDLLAIFHPYDVENYSFLNNGMYNSRIDNIDCSSLKDGKWHNFVFRKQAGFLDILIDGNSIAKFPSQLSIDKIVSLGTTHINLDPAIYGFFPMDIQNKINSLRFFRGGLSAFRLYSRALTDGEIEALIDEYRYIQSDFAGAGGIQVTMDKYSKPILYANFRNIPLNLSKDNVIYEYSISNGTFIPITSITQIGTGVLTLDYKIGVDLSGKSDGKMNIVFRIRSADQSFQNIGTIGFMKIDNPVEIIINQPNVDGAIEKTISASAIDAQLYMTQTRGAVCDASIGNWEEYTNIAFTQKSDNGIRMCYRAFFPATNKMIYRLSAAIQGIQQKEEINKSYSIFTDYLLWSKSLYQKPNDSASMILELLGVNATQSQGTINGITMTDINGDGLVDFLYSKNDTVRRAIIVNNGNYTFKTVYKCAIDGTIYYGDCADTTR